MTHTDTPTHRPAPFAVLWDMDGVIVDSGPYHFSAWKQTLDEENVPFDETDFRRTFGRRNDSIIADMMGEVPPERAAAIAATKETRYRALIAQKGIAALPGALTWIRRLHARGIPQAIVSSAPPENIQAILQALDVGDLFQALVSGEEVHRGKPDPESFLLAAERVGLPPRHCVVIEDAPAGIEAARRAGMRCLALTTSHPAGDLSQADQIVDSMADLPENALDHLVQ